MKAFYNDTLFFPLPPDHRFPIEKYRLLRERVLAEGIVSPETVLFAPPASDAQILLVHDSDYLERIKTGSLTQTEVRRIGFLWSPGLVARARHSVGGTIAACRAALQDAISVNLAGGTHHAAADHGEGFCVFNDVAIAARVLLTEGAVARVAILDGDVHQGNGTATIFAGQPEVFTFSIHGARNFPFRKARSDLDIALPDDTEDEVFLEAFRRGVTQTLERARPDLVIYLAGADPFAGDTLGRLKVSKQGLAARDRYVFTTCRARGLPVAIVMGGGYAVPISDTVDIHFNTVALAAQFDGQRGEPLAGGLRGLTARSV